MKKVFSFFIAIFVLAAVVSAVSDPFSYEEQEVQIKTVQTFAYCCIHHKGPFTDIENVIAQLFPTMQSQNIPPAGAMVGVYYNSPQDVAPEDLEWDIGFPCTAQVSPLKPLEKKIWEFEEVAFAIHIGPYEKTGETYTKILEWMESKGYEQAGPVLEKYLNMPTQDTDPETLRTEIWIPVKKK